MPAQTHEVARTLIDALLEEQRNLTAVERFARWHEGHGDSEQLKSHRALIPLSAPRPGEQYAFEVNLDRCSGCKSCVTACHALNGLDEDETWRSVGLLHGGKRNSFQQTITTACHHCVDPACLNGCPVLAYDKNPLTGIVRHLDDQCIGCQYCVFMCPYEVPKYSEARGIVRKCDMCHQRLDHGEAPACVQACPSEAIRITVVKQEEVAGNYRENFADQSRTSNQFLPCSPDPSITLPTTRYVSASSLPARLNAGDTHEIRLEPTHAPLVLMLVFTQFGAGGFALLPLMPQGAKPMLSTLAYVALLLGLSGSILHLGQPLKAWRAFLGLRRSWLSREIVGFGFFALLASVTTICSYLRVQASALAWTTSLVGLAGVFCSGMTYHVTQRECWRGELSLGRFFGTTLVLGLATAWCCTIQSGGTLKWLAVALAVATIVKISRELALLRSCPDDADSGDDLPTGLKVRTAYLMRFRQGGLLRSRFACAWIGGVAVPLTSLLCGSPALVISVLGLSLCVVGELIERVLFFRAVATRKMPGSVSA